MGRCARAGAFASLVLTYEVVRQPSLGAGLGSETSCPRMPRGTCTQPAEAIPTRLRRFVPGKRWKWCQTKENQSMGSEKHVVTRGEKPARAFSSRCGARNKKGGEKKRATKQSFALVKYKSNRKELYMVKVESGLRERPGQFQVRPAAPRDVPNTHVCAASPTRGPAWGAAPNPRGHHGSVPALASPTRARGQGRGSVPVGWDGAGRRMSQSGALQRGMLPTRTHPNAGTRSIPRGGSASGAAPRHQDAIGEDAGDGGVEGQRRADLGGTVRGRGCRRCWRGVDRRPARSGSGSPPSGRGRLPAGCAASA